MTVGQLTTCRRRTDANLTIPSWPRKMRECTCELRSTEVVGIALMLLRGNLMLFSTATRTSSQVTFPIDFFEHNQQLTDVEFGGNDLLQVYNAQQIKHRLNSTGMYVANTKVRTDSTVLGSVAG